jgi:hypothetical protein
MKMGATYFIIALLVYIFAEGVLQYLSLPFAFLFILAVAFSIRRMKTVTWVNIIRKDGSRLSAVPFTSKQDSQRIEFIDALRNYIQKPNQQE